MSGGGWHTTLVVCASPIRDSPYTVKTSGERSSPLPINKTWCPHNAVSPRLSQEWKLASPGYHQHSHSRCLLLVHVFFCLKPRERWRTRIPVFRKLPQVGISPSILFKYEQPSFPQHPKKYPLIPSISSALQLYLDLIDLRLWESLCEDETRQKFSHGCMLTFTCSSWQRAVIFTPETVWVAALRHQGRQTKGRRESGATSSFRMSCTSIPYTRIS